MPLLHESNFHLFSVKRVHILQGYDVGHRPDSRNGHHPHAYGYPPDTQRTTEEEEEDDSEEDGDDSYSASDRTMDPSESVTSSFLDSAREPVEQ